MVAHEFILKALHPSWLCYYSAAINITTCKISSKIYTPYPGFLKSHSKGISNVKIYINPEIFLYSVQLLCKYDHSVIIQLTDSYMNTVLHFLHTRQY